MPTKTTKARKPGDPVTGEDVFLNPEFLFLSQLKQNQTFTRPKAQRLSDVNLAAIVLRDAGKGVFHPPLNPPLMQLSARHPYDPLGYVEMYEPGRWDTSTDTVFMTPITHGNSVSEWTGTAAYIYFTPPTNGTYILVAEFYGYQVVMTLNAAGGTTTASSHGNSPAAVTALFSGNAGVQNWFNLACTGLYLGYLRTIRVYQL
jgi:hypothetical protein